MKNLEHSRSTYNSEQIHPCELKHWYVCSSKVSSCTLQSHVCIHVLDCVMNSGPRGNSRFSCSTESPGLSVSTANLEPAHFNQHILYILCMIIHFEFLFSLLKNLIEYYFHDGIAFLLLLKCRFKTSHFQKDQIVC